MHIKRPMFLRFAGLGDDLFVSTIAYYFWKEKKIRPIVGSRNPSIYYNNPGILLIPTKRPRLILKIKQMLEYSGIAGPVIYMTYQPDEIRLWSPLRCNILKILAEKVGIKEVPVKPLLFLNNDEKNKYVLKRGNKKWIAIHSIGTNEMTENKNWYPDRFGEVSVRLMRDFNVVQIGLISDPPIPSNMDLRGRTTPREAAAVIKQCCAVVCQEGFIMHAAAAMEVPAVVIYGGFISPMESGYKSNISLFTKMNCSPCWLVQRCPIGKPCMDNIDVNSVVDAVYAIVNR